MPSGVDLGLGGLSGGGEAAKEGGVLKTRQRDARKMPSVRCPRRVVSLMSL